MDYLVQEILEGKNGSNTESIFCWWKTETNHLLNK